MTNPEITAAKKLGARAAQRLDALPAANGPSRGRRRLGRARPPRDHPGERLPARGRAASGSVCRSRFSVDGRMRFDNLAWKWLMDQLILPYCSMYEFNSLISFPSRRQGTRRRYRQRPRARDSTSPR